MFFFSPSAYSAVILYFGITLRTFLVEVWPLTVPLIRWHKLIGSFKSSSVSVCLSGSATSGCSGHACVHLHDPICCDRVRNRCSPYNYCARNHTRHLNFKLTSQLFGMIHSRFCKDETFCSAVLISPFLTLCPHFNKVTFCAMLIVVRCYCPSLCKCSVPLCCDLRLYLTGTCT